MESQGLSFHYLNSYLNMRPCDVFSICVTVRRSCDTVLGDV